MLKQKGFTTFMKTERGFTPVALIILAAVGIILYLLISSTFPFKDQLFSWLYPKPTSKAAVPDLPDIDVTYIARTPRYYRYCVNYPNGIPTLCSGTENYKRWPSVGETITYTAHIINKGKQPATGFSYQWLVDGSVVESSSSASLDVGQEATMTYANTWSGSRQSIQFKVDAEGSIAEIAENNNSLTIGSNDLTLSIWVEQGLYDIFNNTLNLSGSYSFEDWIEGQFAKMNERFSQAKYPMAADGIKDRVRIDKIVVADDLDGASSPMNSDTDFYLIDGRWQFKDNDPTNAKGQGGDWQNYVNRYVSTIDWGLIHEMAHQMGVIDLYRMNLANDPLNNNRIQVRDINGNLVTLEKLPLPIFPHPGIMSGGDVSPYNDGTYFESHTAAGLNSHYNYRRGHYGEYLYDTPTNTSVKVLDEFGNPLADAQVAFYQKDPATEYIDNTPEITGTTDGNGRIQLPNRSVTSVTTVTGHTLKNNPFGQINVVGTNGTMIVKATKNAKEGYGFLTIHDLNIAYWSGNTSSAVITVKTNYPPEPGDGDGLSGTYFDNMDLTSQVLVRVDPTVNFDWGGGSPDSAVAPDTFSARWTGQVQSPSTETYTFYTRTDDGARLWVNDQLLVDGWRDQSPTEYNGSIPLVAGQKYNIKMEYYENGGGAVAQLSWNTPTITKQIIPRGQLFSGTAPSPSPSPTPTPTSTPTPTPTPSPDTQPPTAPTNLTANPVSSSQINLSWNPSTDNVAVTGYDVYRNNTKIATVTTTSYGDTGLTASTTYTYFVKAFDGAGNISPSSNTISATTQPAQSYGSITGTVYSSAGGVVAGARVTLKVGKANWSYLTNSQGIFNITNIPPGKYSLSFRKSGYTTQTANVDVVAGQTVILRVALTKK